MESQEELITQLNQMNTQKNEALLNTEANQIQQDTGTLVKLEQQLLESNCKLKTIKAENEELKRQKIEQKLVSDKQRSSAEKNSTHLINQLEV